MSEAAPEPEADSSDVAVLPDGKRIKTRAPRMRACDQPAANGKLCLGHLKRWFQLPAEVADQFGPQAELYRCERCHTIYLPNPQESPRSGTLSY